MRKPKLNRRYTKFFVRVCMILCLCMVLGLLSRPSTKATAAGAEGLITIEMSDSYGDGWSDNGIEVYADGELLGIATMDDIRSNSVEQKIKAPGAGMKTESFWTEINGSRYQGYCGYAEHIFPVVDLWFSAEWNQQIDQLLSQQ